MTSFLDRYFQVTASQKTPPKLNSSHYTEINEDIASYTKVESQETLTQVAFCEELRQLSGIVVNMPC
jgi:hypothetical protein